MPHRYDAKWKDVENVESRNWFYASSQADAEAVLEDLVAICAASWIELKEDGTVVTPASSDFNQPAGSTANDHDIATLEMRTAASRARHTLKLHSVLPSYLNGENRSTTVNPFSEIGRIRTSEDEQLATFVRARYRYRNKER